MSDIICPKCNQVQKKSKNNFCSYCYYSFDNNLTKNVLTVIDQNFTDEEIKDILKIEKNKIYISTFKGILAYVLVIITGILNLVINEVFFPFSIQGEYPIKFFIFISFLSSFFIYRFLNNRYDLNTYISENFNRNRLGKEPTFFEKKGYFIIILIGLTFMINFTLISTINNFTSIVFLPKKYKTFIMYKSQYKVKNGYNYFLHLVNWERNNKNEIKIKVSKTIWNNYQENKEALVKVRSGIFWTVIWDLKQ